jgi:hypothetical protein
MTDLPEDKPAADHRQPGRRRKLFKRAVLVLLLVVLASATYYERGRRQAIRTLQARGAKVVLSKARFLLVEVPFYALASVHSIELYDVSDRDLESVAWLGETRILSVYGQGLTEEGVRQVAELTHLHDLHLSIPEITPEGLGQLARLKNLRSLTLQHTRLPPGLGQLGSLPNLMNLSLRDVEFGADSFQEISKLEGLQGLMLVETNVEDAWLQQLAEERNERQLPFMRIMRWPPPQPAPGK